MAVRARFRAHFPRGNLSPVDCIDGEPLHRTGAPGSVSCWRVRNSIRVSAPLGNRVIAKAFDLVMCVQPGYRIVCLTVNGSREKAPQSSIEAPQGDVIWQDSHYWIPRRPEGRRRIW